MLVRNTRVTLAFDDWKCFSAHKGQCNLSFLKDKSRYPHVTLAFDDWKRFIAHKAHSNPGNGSFCHELSNCDSFFYKITKLTRNFFLGTARWRIQVYFKLPGSLLQILRPKTTWMENGYCSGRSSCGDIFSPGTSCYSSIWQWPWI